jgi:hypothetical protein
MPQSSLHGRLLDRQAVERLDHHDRHLDARRALDVADRGIERGDRLGAQRAGHVGDPGAVTRPRVRNARDRLGSESPGQQGDAERDRGGATAGSMEYGGSHSGHIVTHPSIAPDCDGDARGHPRLVSQKNT